MWTTTIYEEILISVVASLESVRSPLSVVWWFAMGHIGFTSEFSLEIFQDEHLRKNSSNHPKKHIFHFRRAHVDVLRWI